MNHPQTRAERRANLDNMKARAKRTLAFTSSVFDQAEVDLDLVAFRLGRWATDHGTCACAMCRRLTFERRLVAKRAARAAKAGAK